MDMIYHFTNQAGLTGILSRDYANENNRINLWFTRADCLNDSSEGTNMEEIYHSVISEMHKSKSLSTKQYQKLKEVNFNLPTIFFETKDHVTKAHIVEADVYICSFSKANDELDLWRYYSKGSDGFCIGFRKHILKNILKSVSSIDSNYSFCKVEWHDVTYSDNDKKETIKKIVQENLSTFCNEDEHSLFNLLKITESKLNLIKYSFKHSCFSSEQEVRCVIKQPKEKNDKSINPTIPVRERLGYGKIIPYLNLEFDIHALCSVLVSPMASFGAVSAAQEYVNKFMENTGHKITVVKSQLPVRY